MAQTSTRDHRSQSEERRRAGNARADAARDGRDPRSDAPLDPEEGVAAFIAALDVGEPWYQALLDVVARWTAASELVDGRAFTYLIGGEAFDWLLLAERLIGAAGERVPAEEAALLVTRGVSPLGEDEEAFAGAIGPRKYRAHLNFQYGVIVEELLLLVAEQELQKARPVDGVRGVPPDVAAYELVYGVPLGELQMTYRLETGEGIGDRTDYASLQAFTYWCSKYRVKHGEPERVASDTRKALALLTRMHADRRRYQVAPPARDIEVAARDG